MALAPLLTPEEVSAILGVPVQTLYAWRARRPQKGPPASSVGRHLRYDEADLRAWIEAQKTARSA